MNSLPQLAIQLGWDPAVRVQVQTSTVGPREIRRDLSFFGFLKEMATTKKQQVLSALSRSRYTDHDIIVSFEQKHCKKPIYYIHIRVYFKVVELHIMHPGIPFNMWFCRDVAILIRSPTRWSCADLRKPNLEHSCAWSATWIHVKDLEVKKRPQVVARWTFCFFLVVG